MRLLICAVGQRMPAWVGAGFDEYVRRMPREAAIELIEIRPQARPAKAPGAAAVERLLDAEAQRIRAALPRGCRLVVLDEKGKSFATVELARLIETWMREGGDTGFVIGGADGVQDSLKRDASLLLSLSRMTLPHQLVRVLLAEQLYRSVSLLHGHPYHRE